MNRKTSDDWIDELKSLKQWAAIRSLDVRADVEAIILRLEEYGRKHEKAKSPSRSQAGKTEPLLTRVGVSSPAGSERKIAPKTKPNRPKQKKPKAGHGPSKAERNAEKLRQREQAAFGVFQGRSEQQVNCHACKCSHRNGWLYKNSKGQLHCYCTVCRNKYLPKNLAGKRDKSKDDAMLRRVSGSFGARQ